MDDGRIEWETPDGKVIVYHIARPEDVEEVATFAAEHFFNESPIRELASFDDPSDKAGWFYWRQGRLQKCFANPTSVIYREMSTGQVIGFSAAILEEREHDSIPISTNLDRSPGWLNRALAAELNRDIDLYARFGTDRILHFWFGAIRKDYRGKDVTFNSAISALVAKIIRDTKAGGYKTEAFSYYAVKSYQSEDIIRSIDFADFELADGSRPLARVDLGVHRTAHLIAARIPKLEKVVDNTSVLKSKM